MHRTSIAEQAMNLLLRAGRFERRPSRHLLEESQLSYCMNITQDIHGYYILQPTITTTSTVNVLYTL